MQDVGLFGFYFLRERKFLIFPVLITERPRLINITSHALAEPALIEMGTEGNTNLPGAQEQVLGFWGTRRGRAQPQTGSKTRSRAKKLALPSGP